jgi:hypothetical protein
MRISICTIEQRECVIGDIRDDNYYLTERIKS